MADQDELRLKLVLDTEAFDEWFKQYQNRPAEIPLAPGGTKGGGKGASSESAELKREIQTRIDLIDLEARTMQRAANEQIKSLQQRAAAGKITTNEMVAGIQLQEAAQERATQLAMNGYAAVEKQIAQTTQLTLAQSVALEKKLFFAQERASTGFVSMSRSMGNLTTGTKDANIAFANFGRIVQDAPFGLLGLSNNIDPLLQSFAQLKASSGGTGAALKALGAQLMGPAGLIFLLGSALPTALLFLQKHMQDAKGTTNELEQALASLRNQMAEEFAKAAAEVGIDELNAGLSVSTFQLEQQKEALKEVEAEMTRFALSGMAVTESQREQARALREQRDEIKANILDAQANVDQFTTQIALLKQRQKVEQETAGTSIARAKEEREAAEEEKKRLKIAIENYGIMENLRALQIAYNDDLANSLNEVIESARRADVELATALRSITNAIGAAKDELINDDSDFDRAVKAEERLGQMRIDMLRMSGDEEAAIVEEGERRKRQAKLELLKLGITDKETLDKEAAMIDAETAMAIEENDKQVAQNKAEQLQLVADSANQILGAIFGENKAVQSAQVVIDTLAGANRAFQQYGLPFGAVAAAANIAQGISTLRKINSSTRKSNSIGNARSTTSTATVAPAFDNVRTTSGTSAMFVASSTSNPNMYQPNLNINANVDRQGLAIAVREGEAEIRSQQIAFS